MRFHSRYTTSNIIYHVFDLFSKLFFFQRILFVFFSATSNGTLNSLDNHNGGRCKNNNMRLAVTVCGAHENCVQHNNLCKTPKTSPKPHVEVTTTTKATTTTMKRAKPTMMTTRTTENGEVVKPKAAPKQSDEGK